ncbi:MAG: hypothetical protein E6Q25_09705 [Acinetobacter sp.]|nr:MAG: hypothetical protein E6Q25_09705 [Acinetobacter sp.]
MLFKEKIIFLAISLTMVTSSYATILSDFGEPNKAQLVQAMKDQTVHIVQFGDSHTAADVWTDALRTQLQHRLGNGGMGWGMPMYFSGHRLEEYGYDVQGWQSVSSRTQHDENYTLGGLLAVPRYSGATLTIKSKRNRPEQAITVSLRQTAGDGNFTGVDANGKSFSFSAPRKDGTWQVAHFDATLPFTITAHDANRSAIAGWWAKNKFGQGAVVSALGINGAELRYWNRWNTTGWQQELKEVAPSLIILAYGTNEAYNNNIDIGAAKQLLESKIMQIRQASPNSAILIVSAPESLKSTAGQCGVRPAQLTAFQNMQIQVARQSRTLFWDWQQAMGGNCSMKSWISRGDARGDGVHFSPKGYQKLGTKLAEDLLNIAEIQSENTIPSYNSAPIDGNMPAISPIISTGGRGSISSEDKRMSYNDGSVYIQTCIEGKGCKSVGNEALKNLP